MIRTGVQPWITTIPEWDTVLEGWNAGLRLVTIRRWLIEECGYSPEIATRQRVDYLSKQYPRRSDGRS